MLTFIKREKIYISIVLFILAINLISIGRVKEQAPEEKTKAFSTMTFEEIGVTEEKAKTFLESEDLKAKFFKYFIVLGFFIFILSIILNISFVFRRRRINLKSLPYKKPVSWNISDLIRASLVIIFISYIIAVTGGIIFKVFHLKMGMNLQMILNTFFIDIAAGIVILYFVTCKYKERLEALGLKLSSFFKNILSGIKGYIFIIPGLFVTLVVSMYFLNLLGYTPPVQPVFEAFMEEESNKVLLFLTIFVSIFGPIIEEIFFRGFMYSAIKKRFGILIGAFVSSSIFSILHTNIAGFLPIMTLGMLLVYLYEKTGSLVAPITVHIIHNSIIITFVFFVKEVI